MAKAAKPVPDGFHTITASLTLDDAARTIEWYKKALGAEEVSRSAGPDGKIMHAELKIGDSRFMMNDVMMGMKGPKAYGGSPASFWLYVTDADTLFKRAVDAGAEVRMPLENQFWGDRGGAVGDPEGYTWWIASRVEDFTPAEMQKRAADYFKQLQQPAHR
jgi:PhnB protein